MAVKLATDAHRVRTRVGRPPKKYDFGSLGFMTVSELSRETGLSRSRIYQRMASGLVGDQLTRIDSEPTRDRWESRRRSLMQRIEEGSIPIPVSGCWIWNGSLSSTGYAQLSVDGKTRRASRALMESISGAEIPRDIYVCHRCDTPSCVNPDHLFLGTSSDNAQDREAKGRSRWRRGAE